MSSGQHLGDGHGQLRCLLWLPRACSRGALQEAGGGNSQGEADMPARVCITHIV